MLINGQSPDEYQEKAIKAEKNTLLIAAAGSGKTFTILGKLNYLVNNLHVKEEEILLISFTNKSVNDLKQKITINADIFTFHKLALNILKYNNISFKIANDDLLEYITNEFFNSLNNQKLITELLKYAQMYDYQIFLKSNIFKELKKVIITYIHLYKTNAKTISDLKNMYNKKNILTKLILIIMSLYNEELKSSNTFDFDDLIIEATKYTKTYKKYQYIIIDEFQDTSQIRWNLIDSLRKVNNSKIFVVGDDYQSIFRFSGCDINIFLNFTKLVPNSQILKLKYTYRNSQELINISSKFIMKNKTQISKELLSHKHLKKPIKYIFYFNRANGLKKALNKALKKYDDILVLGRNNFDLKKYLPNNIKQDNNGFYYQNKFIKYLTVHSSKGLEADTVILINLEDSLYGFPNKIVNNKLINMIQEKDNYLYAEERRLFYVALTRTRNEIYLLVPLKNKSPFIKEIKKIN